LDDKSWKFNYCKTQLGGAGTQTAGLAFGGITPTPSMLQEQQKNIMEQLGHQCGSLNTARSLLGGAGTQTAALAFGGTPPSYRGNRRI
jgi:hypothetical protein